MLAYYGLLFSVITVLAWGVGNALTKRCDVEYGKFRTAIIVLSVGILPNVLLYIFFPSAFTLPLLLVGAIAGFLLGLGYVLFFKSLETEQASNSYATGLIQSVAIGAFGIIALSEPASPFLIAGAALTVVGVFLVSTLKGLKLDRRLIPAILANIIWAVSWFVVDYAISTGANFIMLLALERTIATVIVLVPYLLYWEAKRSPHRKPNPHPIGLYMGIAAGLLSGIGNLAFAYLTNLNFVGVGAMMTAFVPIITALIVIPLYGERMSKLQWAGVLIATLGAIAIAA